MAEATGNVRELKNFVGGAFVATGNTFENITPVDGSLISVVHEATKEVVDQAVEAARAAYYGAWGSMTTADRCQILYDVADGIEKRFDEFVDAECADTGKPKSLASHLDIPRGAANFRIFADLVKSVGTEAYMQETPDGKGAVNYSVRQPHGVVGVISPWNLPLLLSTWKLAPAMSTGNAVILKPSEETPTTATLLAEVMHDCGVPAGAFNVVHGFGPNSAGEFITHHPGVNAITFTGESATGTAIMKAAAETVKALSFELGGKNPAIVFADCDFDAAIDGTVRSVFANTGQVCLSSERVYVERPIFDKFVAALKEKAETMVIGRPEDSTTQMGSLDQPRTPRQGRRLLRAGQGAGRDRGHRRRHSRVRRRPRRRRLRRAHHLHRPVRGFAHPEGGDLRPGLPRPPRSTTRTRPSPWPTIPTMGWRRWCGRRICRAAIASRSRWRPASTG